MYENYENRINALYSDHERIADIAAKLDTSHVSVSMNMYFNDERPIGVIINEYDIPSEYIDRNLEECCTLAVLTDAAVTCGLGDDIFRGIGSPEERRKLTLEKYIPELFTPTVSRMKSISPEKFITDFEMYANYGGMSEVMLDYYCGIFKDAFIFDIGGSSISDYDYFIVSGDKLFSVNCGMD